MAGIRLLLVIVSYVLAYFLGAYLGILYTFLFPASVTGSLPDAAANWLIGVPTALVVFIFFFLTLAGGKYKYWWIGISLIPAIWFYTMFDLLHIYFPIILGLIAWGLGTMANKMLQKFHPSFMAKFQG